MTGPVDDAEKKADAGNGGCPLCPANTELSRILLRITRWMLRITLILLGGLVLVTGLMAESIPVMLAGVLLPGAELLFKMLEQTEKRIQ